MDALSQAIIDKKGYYNHLKLTNMTRSFNTTGSSDRVYKNFYNVKKEPNLNIERSNTCMKCGNAFTKGHLNMCPAKEIVCNICKSKEHFRRLCKSKGRKPAVNTVDETVNSQNCSYSPEDLQARSEENFCGVINAWTDKGINDNDDYSVPNIRTIYDTNGLETKKLVNIGLEDDAIVNLNIPVDSASPVSFLKQNVLHELKLRNPQLKIHPVEKKTRELYCGFTNDTINIIGKVIVRLQSNGWIADETPFFITSGHERNILGNGNLPRIGIQIAQRQPLLNVNNITRPELFKLNNNSDTILNLYHKYKELFNRVGKIPLDRKITHFHSPFKPIQTKGRRVPLHLLDNVKMELNRMVKEGHIVKLNKCDEDCFISSIVITRKKNGSIKLALDSKLLNNQIFKNKYQMPNIHELIDNIALQLSSKGEVWFRSLDLKNAYSQLQ